MIDASLVVEALTSDTPLGEAAQRRLASDPHWEAPEHLQVEVTAGVRGRWLGGKISDERAEAAILTLSQLTVGYAQWREVAERAWALRDNLIPYDAAYVALTELRSCALVTTDRKLRECPGIGCRVEVVEANGESRDDRP